MADRVRFIRYEAFTGRIRRVFFNKENRKYYKEINGITFNDYCLETISVMNLEGDDLQRAINWTNNLLPKLVSLRQRELFISPLFNRNRTFGVELEVVNLNTNVLLEILLTKNIDIKYEGYTHRVTRHWKIVTDGSLSGRGAYEVVSPILHGVEGLQELKIVLDAMKQAGAKINVSCGLHVHHDVSNLNEDQKLDILIAYQINQDTIDKILSSSRRNSRWASKLEGRYDHLDERTNRYQVLNTDSFRKYGTYEFRQHQGSTDFEKVANWIQFTQSIVEFSSNVGAMAFRKVDKMMTTLQQDVEYWNERVSELN